MNAGLAVANADTSEIAQLPSSVRSECPQCDGELAILRVIGGRAGAEYWAQRCTRCGGIHLDIVQAEGR